MSNPPRYGSMYFMSWFIIRYTNFCCRDNCEINLTLFCSFIVNVFSDILSIFYKIAYQLIYLYSYVIGLLSYSRKYFSGSNLLHTSSLSKMSEIIITHSNELTYSVMVDSRKTYTSVLKQNIKERSSRLRVVLILVVRLYKIFSGW